MNAKILTTEETQNFITDNRSTEIVKGFAYLGSLINSKGDCSQESKRRLTQKGSNEKMRKDHKEQ